MDGKPPVELTDEAAQAPAEYKRPCDDPVEIPEGAMSEGAVERGWPKDRKALRVCEARRAGMQDHFERLFKALVPK